MLRNIRQKFVDMGIYLKENMGEWEGVQISGLAPPRHLSGQLPPPPGPISNTIPIQVLKKFVSKFPLIY